MQRKVNLKKCAGCAGHNIIEELRAGDEVCSDCGLVHREKVVSMQREWRSFIDKPAGGDPNRAGEAENPLFTHHLLATSIAGAQGGRGDARAGSVASLIKTQHRGSNAAADESFRKHCAKVDSVCGSVCGLDLPSKIAQRAKLLCKEAKGKGLRISDKLIVACVYVACEEGGVPRTVKEMASVSDEATTDVDIRKAVKRLRTKNVVLRTGASSARAADLVERFCSTLYSLVTIPMALRAQLEAVALSICEQAALNGIQQNQLPASLAAGAIWMAVLLLHGANPHCTRRNVVDATGAADSTIRTTYNALHAKRHALFPPSINVSVLALVGALSSQGS
mmetsp:Transcript_55884/g.132596  ORF Transcript_55884/g.132596 Transcript_55884/m.132596 type:complete len:336 (+) Transcript_55884:452-1459(+)